MSLILGLLNRKCLKICALICGKQGLVVDNSGKMVRNHESDGGLLES
jgi:hypothetical protein